MTFIPRDYEQARSLLVPLLSDYTSQSGLFLVLLLVTLIRAASNAEGDSYYTSNRATEAQVVELAISVLCQIPTINPNIGIILHLVRFFVHVCMMVDRQVLK